MKIRGKLTFRGDGAGEMVNVIARSLEPDNVPGMSTEVSGDSATVYFEADRVGTMLSSVDDYLMNAKIARDVVGRKRTGNPANAFENYI